MAEELETVTEFEEDTVEKLGNVMYDKLTRNYSRREGTEFFSVTESRYVDMESSVIRKRAERYILAYDVMMAVLEEMVIYGYVTEDFYRKRKGIFSKQLTALKARMEQEEPLLTAYQKELHLETYNEIEMRVK